MPISLPPLSRRRFIGQAFAAGVAAALGPQLFGAEEASDPSRFALLSDTHVAGDPHRIERGVNMYDHMRVVCTELLELTSRPGTVFINGDCALGTGEVSDYLRFLELVRPLREAGYPLHLAMGNHDHREHLWGAIPKGREGQAGIEDKQVVVLDTPRARWIVLDSLQRTNFTPGKLGQEQIDWLGRALAEDKRKPTIVMVHHNPEDGHEGALIDTKLLFDVLLPRKQVKALLFGHTHHWNVTKQDDLHLVNLPAVAYVFQQGDPSGWVDCHLRDDGMHLELRCVDRSHPNHGDKVDLTWRG